MYAISNPRRGVLLCGGVGCSLRSSSPTLSCRNSPQIEILRHVETHEFVVSLIDAFESAAHVEIVMELMEGGELYGRIAAKGPYSERKAAVITQRLASAVRFLHRHGIVHRDLKPENLLLQSAEQDDVVKVRLGGS